MTDAEKVSRWKRAAGWPWAVIVQLAGAVCVVAGGVALYGPAVAVFGAGWGLVLGGAAAEAAKARSAAPAKRRREPDAVRRVA